MMQYTEAASAAVEALYRGRRTSLSLRALYNKSVPLAKSPGQLSSASILENLLVHCAAAIAANDASRAQHCIWVLNNIAPPDGDPAQRLAAAILRALTARHAAAAAATPRAFSAVALAAFLDLTPLHRFGFTAANSAIVDAVQGLPVVHVVDFSTTHCMQMPTLIDALSSRREGPPYFKLTVATVTVLPPPRLAMSYEEIGRRLVDFARTRGVPMEFRALRSNAIDGFQALVEHLRLQQLVCHGEALVVNCQMKLHCVPERCRGEFLREVRRLNPKLVVLVEDDVDLGDGDLVTRLRAALNYLWVHYEASEAVMKRDREHRDWYEAEIYWKIENLLACEGTEKVERLEQKSKWVKRMKAVGFEGISFAEEAIAEVKTVLDEHATGWGMKMEEDGIVLTWKGHNVVFSTVWVPRLKGETSDYSP
ncbi:GRAS family transcription factor isoform X2 [Wolffia australiana]